jgi:hypothetical protein
MSDCYYQQLMGILANLAGHPLKIPVSNPGSNSGSPECQKSKLTFTESPMAWNPKALPAVWAERDRQVTGTRSDAATSIKSTSLVSIVNDPFGRVG